MRVLVTGGTGFVASHLIEQYLQEGVVDIVAFKRRRSDLGNVQAVYDKVKWYDVDIIDGYSVERVLQVEKPDIVHHLAALSFVKASWDSPVETMDVNIKGTLHLLEAVRRVSPKSMIHIASTSEVYGNPGVMPITEETMTTPMSPYGVSKLAAEKLAIQYMFSYGIQVVVTRGFNHTGPRRGEQFAESSFAKQLAEIGGGKRPPTLYVGNLEAKRDYTDVRDMCRAYRMAVHIMGNGGPFNVCSGATWSMRQVLDQLVSISGLEIRIEVDKARLRPSDVKELCGDSSRFCNLTGWKCEIPFTKTLDDLLEYWRERTLIHGRMVCSL